MANSREAPFQLDIIEAITAYGWKAGTAGGYDRKGENVSELELTHYRLTKCEEKHLRQEEAEGDHVTPVSEAGSGKPQNPEKQRLAEIIDRLSDRYGAEVSDDDKLHFANGIGDHIGRDEAVMAQVCHHSEDNVMHSLFPKKVTDALSDHEKFSVPLLEDEETGETVCVADFEVVGGEVESWLAH